MAKSKFYAVLAGHKPGIYLTWAECQAQTKGFSGAKFKSFGTKAEADLYMQGEVVITTADEKKEAYLIGAKQAEKDATEWSKQPGVIAMYTDGSRKKKPVTDEIVFGYGVAIVDNGDIAHSFGGASDNATYAVYENVAGELTGVVEAFRYVQKNRPDVKKVVLFYDYEGIGEWALNRWKAKNIMSQRYILFMNKFRQETGIEIDFRHVKGHVGNKYNEHVDVVAGKAIDDFLAQFAV